MNYPSYFQKHDNQLTNKVKNQENKMNNINTKKQFEEQNDNYTIKGNDSFEVADLKSKLKVMSDKINIQRKQNQQFTKQNKELQKQILTLNNNIRHMIPGFNNTSSDFPLPNQLINKIVEFYKYDCLDKFFDNLCPEQLSMKGIIYFYHFSFAEIIKIIDAYFENSLELIRETTCINNLEGPIMNVLRKSYQTSCQKIKAKIISDNNISSISIKLIQKLGLGSNEQMLEEQLEPILTEFLERLMQICLYCKISDPPLKIQVDGIGKKIKYNSIYNDPLDGFIKNKQECWTVLPEIRKIQNNELFVKSSVLKIDYFDDGNSQDDVIQDTIK